ncbi:MAG: chromosome segregation protein SMC [Candidatus Aminicenantes bacterium RBG_16_63_16]|nr:MAG: chromosome segregation protein SMC [Candidatus Aminicenantes bacterium RBG_16_63_16]
MIIKKLEIQGFKSFPERTKIIFHPGITAIVGPNGTGKSNIVDAILWVLGGQRQKGLRGEKTEDIIFNGNAKKPPLGMADVTLYFEHSQEEETVINHRVFRSGESEYRLNGKPARLKDIQDTLWKRAVAEKEYFVIEQGAIGSLLSAKPAEKRTLLEEAAGTAFYKDKKKEAQSKLASSEQNLIRLEDIITEVGRAKNSLQRQAQAAVRYRKLREKIRELTGLNFRRRLAQLERRHAEAAGQLDSSLAAERELAHRLKTEERELADRRREVWDLEKALKEGQEALFALESQFARAVSDREREAKRIEFLAEGGQRAAAAAAELRQELERIAAELRVCERDKEELGRSLSQKKEDILRSEAAYRSAVEGAAGREGAISTLKTAQFEKLAALTGLRNEALSAGKELELETRREAKLKTQLEEERAQLAAREESLVALRDALAETERSRAGAEDRQAEVTKSLEQENDAVGRLAAQLAEARKARDEDGYHLQAIRKLIEAQAGDPSTGIDGALGRLSDLIDVDPESATLVDALWGEESDSAVIPAAEFLRQAGDKALSGRFLLLAPQEKDEAIPAIDDPRVLGRLKSRLRPDPTIRDSVGRLRDAVIVSDIAAAVELWVHRPGLNFITPGGDLLLSSGLLRLGRKGNGAFVLAGESRKLEERLRERESEIAPLAADLETHQRQAEALEAARREESARIEELRLRVHEQEKEMAGRQAERDRAASAFEILEKELAIWNRDGEALRLRMESLSGKIGGLENEEQELRDRLAAEEKEFLSHRDQHIEDEKRFIGLRAEASLLEERHANLSRQAAGLIDRQEGLEKKVLALEDEGRAAQTEGDEARRAAAGLEAKAGELEVEKKRRHDGLAEMETALQLKRSEAVERDRAITGLREELEKKKEDRVRWEISRAEIDRDLVNLEETCWQELKKTLHEVKSEPVEAELSDAEIEEQLVQTEEDLQRYKSVNLMAEEEYAGHKERHDFLIQQKADLRESIDATEEAIRRIDDESQAQFLNALTEVNKNFQEVFTLLFKGGNAEVRLIDAANPMESGVEIIAQPPGKKVQHIMLLSGGEKSLTSIAFMFALFRYKPTPFCILDEVDAALDDVNLARFLDLMKNIKADTQFIIITHNYKSMEVADYIYGTTMAEPSFTTLYSVKLERPGEPGPLL